MVEFKAKAALCLAPFGTRSNTDPLLKDMKSSSRVGEKEVSLLLQVGVEEASKAGCGSVIREESLDIGGDTRAEA